MKCGSCKQSHDTVRDVRACYGTPSPIQATDKQRAYIRDMRDALGLQTNEGLLNALNIRDASALIAKLEPQFKALPDRPAKSDLHPDRAPSKTMDDVYRKAADAADWSNPRTRPAMPNVPDGYYATRDPDGTVHFWRVSHRNAYLVLQVQASDSLHEVRSYARKVGVAKRIVSDISAARALYASELGRCYACGHTLTDETSRRLGIGPVCRGRKAA